MSLINEYRSKNGISGFSLGYHEFFRRFYTGVYTGGREPQTSLVCFGRGIFSAPSFCYCRHESRYCCLDCGIPKCSHEENGMCLKCCESGYDGGMYYHDHYEIKHLLDFCAYQKAWIKDSRTQDQVRRDPKRMKEECRKRVNFFFTKLYEKLDVNAEVNWGVKVGKTLKDIRKEANDFLNKN